MGALPLKFMYMDESGKDLISQSDINVFIFGGMVLDKDNVFQVLTDFKEVYQKYRLKLKAHLNQNISGPDKGKRIQRMLGSFELHASEIFNPTKDKRRGTKIYKENPWKYFPRADVFMLVDELLNAVKPYIESIFMYKVEKQDYLDYCTINQKEVSDGNIYDLTIDYILKDYHQWLSSQNKKGALIPDNLDSTIRDRFVKIMNEHSINDFWSEPIVVESHSNAFTQLVDIITYCYYVVYHKNKKKEHYDAIKRAYNKHIKELVKEKDVIENLNSCSKIT